MGSTARPAQSIRKEPDEVDKRLERIRENIWPSDPYLMDLAAPSSYCLAPHLANNWRRSCPFDKNEEQLQYMTFLPHTARGDTMLRTTGDWDDGNGNLKSEPAKRTSGSSSGAISPSPGQPPRKKISLLDYKNKIAGQVVGKTSPKASSSQRSVTEMPPQSAKTVAKPAAKAGEPTRSAPVKEIPLDIPEHKQEPMASRGQKRSADEMAGSQDTKTFDTPQTSTASRKDQTNADKAQAVIAATSPIKNLGAHGLPLMMSPTLPACVEEQLGKLRGGTAHAEVHTAQDLGSRSSMTVNNRATSRSTPASSSLKATVNTKSKDVEPQKSRKDAPLRDSGSASKLKVPMGENSMRALGGKDPTTTSEALISNGIANKISSRSADEIKQDGRSRSAGASINKDSLKVQNRLLIVLKIPKPLRKNCQRILQLQPRPKKALAAGQLFSSSTLQERSRDRPTSNGYDSQQMRKQQPTNGVDSRRINNNSDKLEVVANGLEKRRQGDAEEPPSKRQKPSGIVLSRPQTPVVSAIRSPSIPQRISAHKSQFSTPKADRKSTAMDRIKSSEGDVNTPPGSMRSNTPVASSSRERSHNREGRSSSNVSAASIAGPAKKDEEASVYKAEFTKYADLALSLKREADSLAKLPDGQINTDSTLRRQGLAKAIETALCYMLAFTIKDEPSRMKKVPGDRAAWASLLPYFKFLNNITRDTESSQLQGLLYQLEGVCRQTILESDYERLERDGLSDDTLPKQLAENSRLARQAWIYGTQLLTHDEFRQNFPETWAQRSKVLGENLGKLPPKCYGEGSYFLPLSATSTNIEAVRAGWSFLEEWCKKEGVKWDGKIGL
ncbi:MAG: hypothetical protein Q9213_001082 [Squamulea squamosa]